MTDYIAVGKVFPERIAEIVSGIAKGCAKAGTALIGGETAEHPGLLAEDEFDIAGAATGAVDYENLLGSEKVKAGDIIIAMPASGIHANGFSLVRHILKTKNLKLTDTPQNFSKTLGEVLLTPTEIYSLDCIALIKGIKTDLHAFTHITGGGIADNTARVIPAGLKAVYDRSTWVLPIEMQYLAEVGGVPQADMERTWNCGIGMAAIVAPEAADLTIRSLAARGMKAWAAGQIQANLTANNAQNGAAALEATFATR
jgi:phosphoribosylformylglycinamidine cyclo-ligase